MGLEHTTCPRCKSTPGMDCDDSEGRHCRGCGTEEAVEHIGDCPAIPRWHCSACWTDTPVTRGHCDQCGLSAASLYNALMEDVNKENKKREQEKKEGKVHTMSRMPEVKLKLPGPTPRDATLIVDGVDMTKSIRAITINVAVNDPTTIVLDMYAGTLEVEAPAQIKAQMESREITVKRAKGRRR